MVVVVLVAGTVAGTVAWNCDIREALAVTGTVTVTALLHSTGTELELGLRTELRTTRYWDGLRLIVIIAARPRLGDTTS